MNNQNNNENKTSNDINTMINDLPTSALNDNNGTEKTEILNIIDSIPESKPVNNTQTNQEQTVPPVKPVPNIPVTPTPTVPVDSDIPKFSSTSSTLGTLAPDKQKSPIAMIVLFIILMLFIAFMPQIITLVNNVLGTNLNANNGASQNNSSTTTDTNTPSDTTDKDTTEDTIYNIDSTTTIKIDDITITNLTKNNSDASYNLSFTLTNTGTTAYTFTKRLYLELYDENNTFINRSLVNYTDSLSANSSANLTVSLNSDTYSKAKKLNAVLRTSDDYPAISLVNNTLTCKNATNTITYTFSNDSLVKILDVYNYTKTNDATAYNTDLLINRSRISRMDNLNGVDAVLTENTTGFITSTAIDYSLAKYSELTYKTNYFAENTLSKVVSFELAASGFTCN